MSNMVRIFTGTAEQILSSRENPNPFCSFAPYYYGGQTYQLVWVTPEAPDGEDTPLLCFADFPVNPGDKVQGLTCRNLGGTPVAVLLEQSFQPLLELDWKLESLAEYTSFRLNQDSHFDRLVQSKYMTYPNHDGAQAEAVLRSVMDARGIGSTKAILATAHVDSCAAKGNMMFCTATLTVQLSKNDGVLFSFQISRYIDYEADTGTPLSVLIYLGKETVPAIHILPLAPIFSQFVRRLDEQTYTLLARFLSGNAFRMLGRILYINGSAPGKDGTCHRIMVTSIQGSNGQYLVRPLSLYNRNNSNRDSYCVFKKRQYPGNILEVDITVDRDGKYFFRIPFPVEKKRDTVPGEPKPVQAPVPPVPQPAEDAEPKKLLSVWEHEISLWKDDSGSSTSPGGKKDYSFKSARFQYSLLSGELDTLHYDVLHWIGILRYTTANHIYWLFLSGILPQDPDALNESQKQTVSAICEHTIFKTHVLPEGDHSYTVEFPVRSNNGKDRLQKIISKLRDLGLIEFASFRTQQNAMTTANILLLTEAGKNLLKALLRKNSKFDTFAYLRPIRQVKTILSANQLCIAYMQELNRLHPIQPEDFRISPTIVVRQEDFSKDSMVRVGFSLPLHNADGSKTVMLIGESIRNTVGLSKQLDDQSIREKIPRLLYTVRRHAELEQQHTVLTMVFTSYQEITAYADFIREELAKLAPLEYFHVYLTYDMLLLGTLDGSHFRLHPESGSLERVQDMTAQLEGYLQ